MKAAVLRDFGAALGIEDLQLTPPQGSELRVRIHACAICHSDITFIDGGWGGQLPAVFGHEAAGVVEEIGPECQGLKIGDHVVVTLIRHCGHCLDCLDTGPWLCGEEHALNHRPVLLDPQQNMVHQGLRTGAFAEEAVVDQSQVVKIPHDIPMDAASLLACGVITGLGAVTRTAAMPVGSRCAVIGLGGVGLNCVQGAVLNGARQIIGIDASDSKMPVGMAFGCTDTMNVKNTDDPAAAVKALTQGRGVDYVFVAVGAKSAMQSAAAMLRPGGTMVMVGMPATGVDLCLDAADFASASYSLIGSKMGSTHPQRDIPALVDLYQQGRLKLDELISNRFPLEDINQAIDEVKKGHVLRNVLILGDK